MDKDAKIIVTGGTGFIGSYLLRKLILAGYTNIRATKREDSDMALVTDIQDHIEWITADMLDIVALEDAMIDMDYLFHAAAVVSFASGQKQLLMEANAKGTANVVNVALKEGITKMVHVSSVAAIGRSGKDTSISEKTAWEKSKYNTTYAKSKHLAEMEVWRGMAEGLDAIIINPSIVLGSGNWKSGSARMFLEVWNGLRFYVLGETGFVDVRDVAELMVLMMESKISGERYIASGENLPFRQVFDQIANELGKKPPGIAVTPLLRGFAWRLEWARAKLMGLNPLVTKETSTVSSATFHFDNSKSVKTFDFTYRPIGQTITETCRQFLVASKNEFQANRLPF